MAADSTYNPKVGITVKGELNCVVNFVLMNDRLWQGEGMLFVKENRVHINFTSTLGIATGNLRDENSQQHLLQLQSIYHLSYAILHNCPSPRYVSKTNRATILSHLTTTCPT